MIRIKETQNRGFGSFLVIEDDLIGRYIDRMGFWEIHLLYLYDKFLGPEDTALDAGANIGFHTVNMALRCKKVYSFEPQRLIYNLLSTNILFSDVSKKVDQYRYGLSDSNGTLEMEPLANHDERDGSHNYGGRGLIDEGKGEEQVILKTFDGFNLDIDLLKIDIQGHELYAIRGMMNTLQRCKPWILLENYIDLENDQLVIEKLKGIGYNIYRPKQDQAISREDCVCLHPDNLKHYKIKECLETELSFVYELI